MSVVTVKTNLTDSVRAYYDKLFQDGFLVSVHVSKWSMSTHLKKEDINYAEDVPSIFKLGKKMLIEPERFNEFSRVESKARRLLDLSSYDFPVGDAHFVPKKKVAELLASIDKCKIEFNKLKDSFIENYEAHKNAVLQKYPDLAEELLPHYPKVDTLAARFNFSVSLYEIQMPKELGEIDIASLIDRDKAKEEVKEKLEAQLAEHYKTSLKKLETFTEEAAALLRTQIVSMCSGVIYKIENKEVVSNVNIKMIRDEIENFRKLNFMDDKAVADELDKLEKVVSGNVNYKTDKEALQELNKALTNVLDKANSINDLSVISDKYFNRAIKI